MSLDKAIAHGKEHRKNNLYLNPYCRNHGGCCYCMKDRINQRRKVSDKAESKLSEEALSSDRIRSLNRMKRYNGV